MSTGTPMWSWLTRRSAPGCARILGIGLAVACSGCLEPLGPPERFPTATVSGVVLEAGRPVSGGWIELIPVDGTVGDQRSAELSRDGSFRVDRVPIGEVAVRLVNAPIRLPQAARVFAPFSTPIRRRTEASPAGPLRIDLMEELLQFQANPPRRPRLDPALEPGEEATP